MSGTIYINQYVTGRTKAPVIVTHWSPAFALLVHSSKYQVVIAAMMLFSGEDTHLQYLKRGRQMCRPLIITPLICTGNSYSLKTQLQSVLLQLAL